MAFDAHKNLAVATIVTPPAPAASGTTVTVGAGEGARFPAAPFNATVWPVDMAPSPVTAEVVRVTARTGDQLTITRAQEGTTARAVIAGDQIAATITAKVLTDLESGVNFPQLATTGVAAIGGLLRLNEPANQVLRVDRPGNAGAIFTLANNNAYCEVGLESNTSDALGTVANAAGFAARGSAGLSLLATHAAGVIRFVTGGFAIRGIIHASGGLSWGSVTDPGADKLSVSGGVSTIRGTVSGPNATPATLFTAAAGVGQYLVSAGLNVNVAPSYAAFATVAIDGTDARIVANNGTLLTLSVAAGRVVQATQSSGGTQTIVWVALRVG